MWHNASRIIFCCHLWIDGRLTWQHFVIEYDIHTRNKSGGFRLGSRSWTNFHIHAILMWKKIRGKCKGNFGNGIRSKENYCCTKLKGKMHFKRRTSCILKCPYCPFIACDIWIFPDAKFWIIFKFVCMWVKVSGHYSSSHIF